MIEPLVSYLHYVSMILIGSFLTTEMVVCRPGMGAAQVRLLPRLDLVYFVSALLALGTGLLRVFFYGKGVGFYASNPIFWVKMALFVAVALISVSPTVEFIRWNRTLAQGGATPVAADIARVRKLVHIEVALLMLIPLAAVLMARGIGR